MSDPALPPPLSADPDVRRYFWAHWTGTLAQIEQTLAWYRERYRGELEAQGRAFRFANAPLPSARQRQRAEGRGPLQAQGKAFRLA